MLSNWRNWCRLCANECAVFKLESLDELNEITLRHFKFSLHELSDVCICICEECYIFVNKLERFKERCLQTSKMLVELCAISTEDDELLESDVQDLRFRFMSDSILTAVDEAPEEKSLVSGLVPTAAPDVCVGATTFDQGVHTSDLVEPELVELKIEKIPTGKRKKQASKEDVRISNKDFECAKDDMMVNIVEDDRLLTSLSMEGFTELDSNVPLMHEDSDDEHDDHYDEDYNVKEELGSESETDAMEEMHQTKKVAKRKMHPKSSSKSPNNRGKLSQKTRCDTCDTSFRTRSLYVLHLQNKHPDSKELSFACSACPKRFPSERKAKLHESVHLPSDQKLVHACKYCDKKFSKLVNVQAHIKAVHIGERPYICEECGKAFGTKGALKEHQITHSDDKPYQCAHCPKKFKNLPRLKTHEDIHNDTLYVCPHCGLQLNTKRTLKMHMVVHSDQKRFKCQYCGNEYKRSKALKNHLILHTGLRPYQCPFCEKTFANGSNCRSHKKKAHPMELAALEASGKQTHATNIPKLEQLQPKPHQITSLPGAPTSTPTTAAALNQQPPTDAIAISPSSSTASQQQQHQATIIATSPTPSSLVDAPSTDEMMLHRGVRLVTAYFHSQSEPPPLNILSTSCIKHEAPGGACIAANGEQPDHGRGFQSIVVQQEPGAVAPIPPPPTEQLQLTVSDMVSLPPLQLIATSNL
ncbi:zinc finger protein 718-like [Ochlerotatus camptorhynchus]|uniref:zinc finger protein 718-like n=1 Tax=Ochlerotatus camptorhynchus TaxID=644619 RepID=UPI0031DE3497